MNQALLTSETHKTTGLSATVYPYLALATDGLETLAAHCARSRHARHVEKTNIVADFGNEAG